MPGCAAALQVAGQSSSGTNTGAEKLFPGNWMASIEAPFLRDSATSTPLLLQTHAHKSSPPLSNTLACARMSLQRE